MTKEEYLNKKEEVFWWYFKGGRWSGKYKFMDARLNQPKTCYYIDFCMGTLDCHFAIPVVYHKEGNVELKLTQQDIDQFVKRLHDQMDAKDVLKPIYIIETDSKGFESFKDYIWKNAYKIKYNEKKDKYTIVFDDIEKFDPLEKGIRSLEHGNF